MNCDETRETLLNPVGGAAGRQKLAGALEHLENCAACREAMNDFDRLWSILQSTPGENSDLPELPAGGWSAFEQRLTSFETPLRPWGWQRPAILGGVAASLLAIGLLSWAVRHPSNHLSQVATVDGSQKIPVSEHSLTSSIVFTPREVAQQVAAFDKVSGVFDRRTSWLLVSDEDSDFGLADSPMQPQRLLLLRLVVLNNKQPVSSADLAIVPGQTANLTLPLAGGAHLQYRIGTSASEQTRLALSVDLLTADKQDRPVAALATTLDVHPGEKISAGRFVTTTGDYELDVAFTRSDLPRDQEQAPKGVQEQERQ